MANCKTNGHVYRQFSTKCVMCGEEGTDSTHTDECAYVEHGTECDCGLWAADALKSSLPLIPGPQEHEPTPKSVLEVGHCECGASYYHVEQVGQPCEIQYCRGTVKSIPQRGAI